MGKGVRHPGRPLELDSPQAVPGIQAAPRSTSRVYIIITVLLLHRGIDEGASALVPAGWGTATRQIQDKFRNACVEMATKGS